jgi:hypothetical protein
VKLMNAPIGECWTLKLLSDERRTPLLTVSSAEP